MNSLFVTSSGLLGLALGYIFYGRAVGRWLGLKEDAIPPAVEHEDGIDYSPAKHWSVLFGHHFASIAGAAPILGPVVVCLFWGWLPAVLWIVLGSVLMGGVHDYFSLTASLENGGRTIGQISEKVLGKGAKLVFGMFVLLALILIVAVFAAVAGTTLATNPNVVLPTFGLIPVAMLVGYLVYRTKVGVAASTVIGLLLLGGLIWWGSVQDITIPVDNAATWWTLILLVYGCVAAVLPVNILLQPRDHLATGVLVFGMGAGYLGLLLTRPEVHSPAVIAFDSPAQGWMWPMLFVTLACGAISGFHSLVASGTTSKQLGDLRHARRVSYGAMILEGALALLAVAAVTGGLYWRREQIPAASAGLVYGEVFKEKGWIGAFGAGYGAITAPLFGSLGMLIGVTMLKTFIMTTLDSATRIARYICSEVLGDAVGMRVFKNRFVATLFIGICSAALALKGYKAIWPVFGSANQLIAALVLITATVYMIHRRRPWQFVAVPALLILATALGALTYQAVGWYRQEEPNYLLITIAGVLVALAVYVTACGALAICRASEGEGVEAEQAPSEVEEPLET